MKHPVAAFVLNRTQLFSLFYLTTATLTAFTFMQFAQGVADDEVFGPLGALGFLALEGLITMTVLVILGRSGLEDRHNSALPLLIVLLLMAVGWFSDFESLLPPGFGPACDIVWTGLWSLCGWLLFRLVQPVENAGLARRFLVAALAMLAVAGSLELSDEGLPGIFAAASPFYQTVQSSAQSAVLMLFGFALLAGLFSSTGGEDAAPAIGKVLSKALFRAEFSTVGATASILFNRAQFALWRRANPGRTFGDFYAWQITRKLDHGRAHRTLGRRSFASDTLFGEAEFMTPAQFALRKPSAMHDILHRQGLRPEHKVVDYGCGSLRLGNRLVRFLDKGNYIGLDITDRFYNDGLALLGADIIASKSPTCSVIDEESLSATRAAEPDFVISEAVLKHIPGEFLDDYFDKLCSLAAPHTRFLLSFTESETERQISGKSWAWSIPRITTMLKARLPEAGVEVIHHGDTADRRNGVEIRSCVIAALPPA